MTAADLTKAAAQPDVPVATVPAHLDGAVKRSMSRRRRTARRRTMTVVVGQILIPVVLLGLWEVAARSGWLTNDAAFYSKPSDIARFIGDNPGYLWRQTRATLSASVVGGVVGFVLGGIAGVLLGRHRTADRMLDPLIAVLNGLPRIALAPVFLLWFGITFEAKVFLAVSIVFFIMLINIRSGIRSLETEYETVAKLLGANQWQVTFKVLIPGIIPVIFGALRLTVVFSVLGVIASEMISAREGLGVAVVQYGQTLNPSGVFAVLAVLAAVMSLLNGLIRIAETRVLRWQPNR